MTTYTHAPTGITVEQREDGSLVATSGSRQFWPPAEITAAIHAAYLDSLGLWLDEQTGYLVSTTPTFGGNYLIYAVRGPSKETAHRHPEYDSEEHDDFQQALARYLATSPQPGERWVLLADLGSVEWPVEVVEVNGETWFVWLESGVLRSERVADRHPSTYRRAEW